MHINRKLGFITPVIRGISLWEHSAASGPWGRISYQCCCCGFHQLIMLGAAEMMITVSCLKAFSAQGYSWFGCVYLLMALVSGREDLSSATYLCQTERTHRVSSDPINAVTVTCRAISR